MSVINTLSMPEHTKMEACVRDFIRPIAMAFPFDMNDFVALQVCDSEWASTWAPAGERAHYNNLMLGMQYQPLIEEARNNSRGLGDLMTVFQDYSRTNTSQEYKTFLLDDQSNDLLRDKMVIDPVHHVFSPRNARTTLYSVGAATIPAIAVQIGRQIDTLDRATKAIRESEGRK